jgi:hypothetical protein
MDERSEDAVETTLQHELFYNERVINHPAFGKVRLARPTLEHEKQIAEYRRKQFQTDMRDPDILSRGELEKLAIARGMWDPERSKRIDELNARTGEAMGLLEAVGFKDFDVVMSDYDETVNKLLALFPDPEDAEVENVPKQVREAITKYFTIDAPRPTLKERNFITDNATSSEVEDLLDTGDVQRTQLDLLKQMSEITKELQTLQKERTRLFVDSVESRADRAEELATVYYCATKDGTGERLWPSVDDMRRAKIADVDHVMMEYHLFRNGITEEFRTTLEKYGFHKRLTDTGDSSDASPDQPPANSDGALAASEPTSSSEATE